MAPGGLPGFLGGFDAIRLVDVAKKTGADDRKKQEAYRIYESLGYEAAYRFLTAKD